MYLVLILVEIFNCHVLLSYSSHHCVYKSVTDCHIVCYISDVATCFFSGLLRDFEDPQRKLGLQSLCGWTEATMRALSEHGRSHEKYKVSDRP